jgi:hypothetical protein
MDLLGGTFYPITSCFGFLEADLDSVVAADKKGRLAGGKYGVSPIKGTFPEMLNRLLPLTGPLLRNIWVRTSGPWTAYFDNFVNGGDPYGPICHGAREIKCKGIMILNSPQTPTSWGGARFTIFGPKGPPWGNIVREISAINDEGRWDWTASGKVQPFEEVSRYGARRIKDRLTPEMLERYCAALGIRAFDGDFYGYEGYLVENENIDLAKVEIRSLTLDAAQREASVRPPPALPLS